MASRSSLLRWKDREISNPCLVIANDFGLKIDGVVKYRAKLTTEAPFFCIAGVWQPATGELARAVRGAHHRSLSGPRTVQGRPRRGGPRRRLDHLADAGSSHGRHAAALSGRQLRRCRAA